MKHLVINTLLAALCLMTAKVALALSPMPAPDTPDFSAEQQAQIGKIAADYLLAHPEILTEMNGKLQAAKVLREKPRCAPIKNTGQPVK